MHTPDSTCCGVGSWLDVPGWKLLGEGADVGPISRAGENDCFGGGGAENGELFGSEDVGYQDEAITVEGFEVVGFGHVMTMERLFKISCEFCCFVRAQIGLRDLVYMFNTVSKSY